jgi:hypothetical protein
MEKIKAKVENVLHKDKDTTHDTTHTGTTGSHTTGTHTTGTHTTGTGLAGSTHSKSSSFTSHSANINSFRRPYWPSQLAHCQPGRSSCRL